MPTQEELAGVLWATALDRVAMVTHDEEADAIITYSTGRYAGSPFNREALRDALQRTAHERHGQEYGAQAKMLLEAMAP